ncbi:MAG: transporter [Phenylobacterium sp.]|nr:transporter [Phenylobacterium sp.]
MRRALLAHALPLALGLAAPALAHAEPDKLRDFCAERPGSATPACIVDVGHLMVEVDALDVTRTSDAGLTQQTAVVLAPHLRLGLSETIEAGVQFTPLVEQRVRDRGAGTRTTTRGAGDALIDLKINLKNPDGGGFSAALLPYLSLPTAQRGLGAGGFQGGLILPISLALPAGFSLSLAPEIDVLRNGGGGGGTHGAYSGVVGLGRGLGPGFSGGLELVSSLNDDPLGQVRATSAGASLAWIPASRPNLQFDCGADFGLTRSAPDLRLYLGVSRRF